MQPMPTCTWAPTVFAGHQIVGGVKPSTPPAHRDVKNAAVRRAQQIEALGLSHLLIAQRWWGNALDIEDGSFDCLAMTSLFAAVTERIHLVTAIHPGFFHPTAIAKWGATLDRLTGGRWSINVTSGWNLEEFKRYGIDALTHDGRYARSREFIEVLRGAWSGGPWSFAGQFYRTDHLELQPQPHGPLAIFQGGQSDAAIAMAASHSDWMFLNGGHPEKIAALIARVRGAAAAEGRTIRFALYANPVCRPTDEAAWAAVDELLAKVDPTLVAARIKRTGGAEGMWQGDDPLAHLDTNEGYCSRLIGSPDRIAEQIAAFQQIGVDMLHLNLADPLFIEAVLPELTRLT